MSSSVPKSIPKSVMDAFVAARTGLGERLDPSTLLDWQLARLRVVITDLVRENAFFRKRLAGVKVDALTSLAALSAIPFTTAGELRDLGGAFCRLPQSGVSRIVSLATSGTSGPPKRLYFGEEDLEATRDFYAHGMREMMRPGEKAVIFMGSNSPGGMGELLTQGVARFGGRAVVHGPVREGRAAVDFLRAERPDCVVGLPVQMLRLARLAPALRPKTVLLSGDCLAGAVRRAVEESWDCEVFDHYGLTESGYGGAVECAAHSGLHPRDADLLLEIVEPESGRPLPDGAVGELVVSTLGRRAMPLLRYRTGDLARLLPGPCPCGSPLRRLGSVEGRLADQGAAPSIRELDEALFAFPALLGYTAGLREGRLNVRAELLDNAAGSGELEAFLRERLSLPVKLSFGPPEPAAPGASPKRRLGR